MKFCRAAPAACSLMCGCAAGQVSLTNLHVVLHCITFDLFRLSVLVQAGHHTNAQPPRPLVFHTNSPRCRTVSNRLPSYKVDQPHPLWHNGDRTTMWYPIYMRCTRSPVRCLLQVDQLRASAGLSAMSHGSHMHDFELQCACTTRTHCISARRAAAAAPLLEQLPAAPSVSSPAPPIPPAHKHISHCSMSLQPVKPSLTCALQ